MSSWEAYKSVDGPQCAADKAHAADTQVEVGRAALLYGPQEARER